MTLMSLGLLITTPSVPPLFVVLQDEDDTTPEVRVVEQWRRHQ